MKKNICFIALVLVFVMFQICYAGDRSGNLIGILFDNVELKNGTINEMNLYRNQNALMKFYFDYKISSNIPSNSGLFIIVKDSKDKIINYYDVHTSHWEEYHGVSTSHAEQEIQINNKFYNNEIYSFEICDRLQVVEEGIDKAIARDVYKIKMLIKEHVHNYDIKTLTCECGHKITGQISDLTTFLFKNEKNWITKENKLNVTLWTNSVEINDNGQMALLSILFKSKDGSINERTSIDMTSHHFKYEEKTKLFNNTNILVEPSKYLPYYSYSLDFPKNIKNGDYEVYLLIGDTELKKYDVTVDIPITNSEIEFIDLDSNHWGYNDIMLLASKGIILGYEDGTFKPEKEVTREEFVSMVNKTKATARGLGSYVDVSEDRWSYNAINRFGHYLADVVDNNTVYFYPTKVLTRQEAAKIMVGIGIMNGEYYGEEKESKLRRGNELKKTYSDLNEVDDEMLVYIASAYDKKIMTGTSESTFEPNGSLTRAQAAAIIKRTLYENEKYKPSNNEKVEAQEDNTPTIKDGMTSVNGSLKKLLSRLPVESSWIVYNGKDKMYYHFNHGTDYIYVNSYNMSESKITGVTSGKQSHFDEGAKYLTSLINLNGYITPYGITYEISEDNTTYTFKYSVDGKLYYSEAKLTDDKRSIYVSGINEMIAFILNYELDSANGKAYFVSKTNTNEITNFLSKYKGNSNRTLKDAKITIKKDSIEIVSADKKYILMDNKEDVLEKEDRDYLCKLFNVDIVAYNYAFYKDKYASLNSLGNNKYSSNGLYDLFIYALSDEEFDSKSNINENNNYNLNFERIIINKPSSIITCTYDIPGKSTVKVEFDRQIKDIDIDILNSNNESVLLEKRLGKNKDNINNSALIMDYQMSPGEEFRIVMKNFIDYSNNATKIDEEYTIKFQTTGERLSYDTSKELSKVTIEIPDTLTLDSVIKINLDAGLKSKQTLSLTYSDACFGSGHVLNVTNSEIKVKDLASKYSKGSTIFLSITFSDKSSNSKNISGFSQASFVCP